MGLNKLNLHVPRQDPLCRFNPRVSAAAASPLVLPTSVRYRGIHTPHLPQGQLHSTHQHSLTHPQVHRRRLGRPRPQRHDGTGALSRLRRRLHNRQVCGQPVATANHHANSSPSVLRLRHVGRPNCCVGNSERPFSLLDLRLAQEMPASAPPARAHCLRVRWLCPVAHQIQPSTAGSCPSTTTTSHPFGLTSSWPPAPSTSTEAGAAVAHNHVY